MIKKIYLISIIVLCLGSLIFVLFSGFLNNQPVNNIIKEDKKGIIVSLPRENELISSPLKIEGYVNGDGWIGFEGQVGIVKLFDEQNKELGLAILTADGEWMQQKINFKTTLWFDYPGDGKGKLVFYNENPSGEAERNKTFTLPVKLTKSSAEKTTVKAYFSTQESSEDCSKVFAVNRDVPKTTAVARVALEELLKGPTDFEKYAGISTSINNGVTVKSLTIENGVAKVDFDAKLEAGVAGSCKVIAIRAQIEQTLKQFSTVKSVVISINGKIDDILQP